MLWRCKRCPSTPRSVVVTRQSFGRHCVSSTFSSAFTVPCFGIPLKVFTRSSAPFEYACIVSRAELALVCTVSYTLLAARTTDRDTLASCERACKAVCSLACCFAKWVLGCAAGKVADALLELERVGLVGGGDLVDLIWMVSVDMLLVRAHGSGKRTFGDVGELVLAHSLEGCALHLALELRWDAEKEDS